MGIYYFLALRLQSAVLRRPAETQVGGIYGGLGGAQEFQRAPGVPRIVCVIMVKTIFAPVHRFFKTLHCAPLFKMLHRFFKMLHSAPLFKMLYRFLKMLHCCTVFFKTLHSAPLFKMLHRFFKMLNCCTVFLKCCTVHCFSKCCTVFSRCCTAQRLIKFSTIRQNGCMTVSAKLRSPAESGNWNILFISS